MEHTQIQNRLSAYCDGEMPADQRAEVERHLAECAACSAVLSDMQNLAAMFRDRPAAATDHLVPRVQRAIEAQMRRRAERFVGWLSALAASIALAAGVHLVEVQQTPRVPVGWEAQAVRLGDDSDGNRKVIMAQWFVTNLQNDAKASHE